MSNPTPTPAPCEHASFALDFDIVRIRESGKRFLELSVQCERCGRPFQFAGMPAGMSDQLATVTLDGLKAKLPIVADGERPNPLQAIGSGVDQFNA